MMSNLTLRLSNNSRSIRKDLPLLQTIISGGQTGVDQVSLRVGAALGLATGGWAPRGWKTLDGPAPWLGNEHGLVESGWDYSGRTSANVRDSDATVRFARDFCSTGERCTFNAIRKWEKFHLDILIVGREVVYPEDRQGKLIHFLVENNVRILNVAGNSERTAPGIGAIVENFLMQALGA